MRRDSTIIKPQVQDLAARMKQVLFFIANNGSSNTYDISEKCKIRYSTAHRSVTALKKAGLIRLEAEVKNEKGVPAKEYTLTPKGLHRTIYEIKTWQEKVIIAEKWKKLLNPNVTEWMKFIELLNDPKTEEIVNSNLGAFLNQSNEFGFFVDAVDDLFFDSLLVTMIDFSEIRNKIIEKLEQYPRLKARLLRLLDQDLKWLNEDISNRKDIKKEIEGI